MSIALLNDTRGQRVRNAPSLGPTGSKPESGKRPRLISGFLTMKSIGVRAAHPDPNGEVCLKQNEAQINIHH